MTESRTFNKKILVDWVTTQCERQLANNLGGGDSSWLENPNILPLKRFRRDYQLKFGKEYEQLVYKTMIKSPSFFTIFNKSQTNSIIKNTFDLKLFHDDFKENLKHNPSILILEQSIPISKTFISDVIFDTPSPPSYEATEIIPDIIYMKYYKQTKENIQIKVDSNGFHFHPLEKEKIGISIIDIKATSEENINKSHFIELIYYISAIHYFLKENKLDDQYFITIANNGILGYHFDQFTEYSINSDLNLTTQDLFSIVTNFTVSNYTSTFNIFLSLIRKLWSKAPLYSHDALPKINPKCSKCLYFDDCKNYLGISYENPPSSNPRFFDISLLPYLQKGTVDQLRSSNVNTVQDLIDIDPSLIVPILPPTPLMTELPLIGLKIDSLLNDDITQPPEGTFFPSTIPPFTNISLTINLEQDPITQQIFGFSFNLSIFTFNTMLNTLFVDLSESNQNLNSINTLLANIIPNFPGTPDPSELTDEFLIQFSDYIQQTENNLYDHITYLLSLKNIIHDFFTMPAANIRLIPTTIQDTNVNIISYSDNYLSRDLNNEENLFILLIQQLSRLIQFSINLENLLNSTTGGESLSFGIYYWSDEIINYLEKLLETYFSNIILNLELRDDLNFLLQWFSPPNSNIKNPYFHSKIFDIQHFAKASFGFPIIINYTWHEITKILNPNMYIDEQYWSQNFNYMDHNMWYLLLNEENKVKKEEYFTSITRQLSLKINSINYIRNSLQRRYRRRFAIESETIETTSFLNNNIPQDFNLISKTWYLFSKLKAITTHSSSNQIVYDIPTLSIAKLKAGGINNLRIIHNRGPQGGNNYTYTFNLNVISTYTKVKEGDIIRLIPFELRNDISFLNFQWYSLKVQHKQFDTTTQEYSITTNSININLIEKYHEKFPNQRTDIWYLYPKEIDNWTNKLYAQNNNNGILVENHNTLLLRNDIGRSILGSNLGFKWQLHNRFDYNPINPNETYRVGLSDIYLYSPELLQPISTPSSAFLSEGYPQPDDSQINAINNSLDKVISAIQGPPGTGKSQTIISLLHEYITRNEFNEQQRPTRILISSLSYNAMYVLIEKIRAHRGVDNNPSFLSQLPLYIIGEPSRSHPHADTIEVFSNNRPYRLYRQGETNFERLTLRNATLEDHLPENFIIFANAFRLYKLSNLHPNNNRMYSFSNEFNFNMVIIDEASQYPTDHILSILPFIQNDRYDIMIDSEGLARSPQLQNQVNTNVEDFTKIILVGDNYQLPPVNKIKAPQNLFNILSSIYNYYVDGHNISRVQLNLNYRSNEVIVGITQRLNFYEEIMTFNENIGNTIDLIENNHSIPGWLSQVLNSNTPISSIIHKHRYDLSVSVIEVNISLQIVIQLYETSNILTAEGFHHFWENNLGIVAPHNSQCNLIIQRLLDYFSETNLPLTIDEIRDTISNSITSVEKFQGGARNIIISTVGISSIDQLKSEEDFIYDLTRFNVISSRAKQKFIFITSQNYLQYLPNDKDLMDNISIIRNIVYEYMDISSNFTYNCTTHNDETIEVRWKEF